MAKVSENKEILQGFSNLTDVGLLKLRDNEYPVLQNIRGFTRAKRNGILSKAVLTSGIMGVFDLKVEGDPYSPDKILIVTRNGEFVVYEFSEISTVFDYLFATGITLNLQSPDSNWWSVAPDASTGILIKTGISAPSTTRSTDLFIGAGQLLGFIDASGVWRIYVQDGNIRKSRYATSTATTNYSSALSFVTGVGPVFEDTDLERWRITINNSGNLITTSI